MEKEKNVNQPEKRKSYVPPKVSEPEVTTRTMLAAVYAGAMAVAFAATALSQLGGGEDAFANTSALTQIEETTSGPTDLSDYI